ncbi:ExbD/TolR family protein [Flagellimonas algicola]|uniref:Biopolymer transporter ExbD n=1 Tax=Flagellimonas algicola TaxID=2583815 RepID=A0ABY2WHV8_9FLAO|nr:biopolymer transporter ExbD [Allomuricauda algicola]TMU54428.1 biopolymer transporter ExbD [Allomuricauda algicola]
MPRRKGAPEVNAGSMADIAFLLLIFFLVTTTIETDAGLDRMLPPMEPPEEDVVIKQKNIFTVNINKNGQLLVEDELMDLKGLRKAAMDFLENGADGTCNYCKGRKDPASSDNPSKAIISLKNDRETKYSTYITVQNELVGAYNDLRNREAQRIFGRSFVEMEGEYLDPKNKDLFTASQLEKLKDDVKRIQDMFPQKLSEAETTSN